ncbi:MAG: hypothetical protein GY765_03725 [bacterium]|nr:hypothetical protein [bacterium]
MNQGKGFVGNNEVAVLSIAFETRDREIPVNSHLSAYHHATVVTEEPGKTIAFLSSPGPP